MPATPRALPDNPMGTDGFEFIEYAAPDPAAMAAVFERMGFKAIAKHRHKNVTLYRQGEINFILNALHVCTGQASARSRFACTTRSLPTNARYRSAHGVTQDKVGRAN